MLKISLIVASILLFSSSLQAQVNENFTEKNLPSNNSGSEKPTSQLSDLPKVSINDAPIESVQVNKSSMIEKSQSTIETILLGNRPTSLMFDDEEYSIIERAVDSFKNKTEFVFDLNAEKDKKQSDQDIVDNEKSFIYLASIIFIGQNDWAVWINNQKITNKTNSPFKEVFLSKVSSDTVEVVWSLSLSKWKILSGAPSDIMAPKVNEQNQVQMNFKLSPNQTYSLSTNKVIEGRPLISLIKDDRDSKKDSSSDKNSQQQGFEANPNPSN